MPFNCRGPRLSADELEKLQAELKELEAVDSPSRAQARRRAQIAAYIREQHSGCGEDLTKLIEELPTDDLEHEIQCPVCGTVAEIHRTPPDDSSTQ